MTGWLAVLTAAVVATLAAGPVLARLRRRFAIITVRGQSMAPSYHDGDRVLVRRTTEFQVGDVLVFPMPPGLQVGAMRWLIKRVTAVAGDAVPPDVRPLASADEVPAGWLVVHGDGEQSLDSRQLGLISAADGLGVVTRQLGR